MPPGSRIAMQSLRLAPDTRVSVPINVYAEAPGELSLSDIRVVTDTTAPKPPPAPPAGVCPPTKPGADAGGEECDYCPCCGNEETKRKPRLSITPARRTVVLADCPHCGSVVVKPVTRAVAGVPGAIARGVAGARRVAVRPLTMLRRRVSELALRPASVPRVAVPSEPPAPEAGVSIRAVLGLRVEERTKLEAASIRSVEALAAAAPAVVAAALGQTGTKRAAALIARAGNLLLRAGG
jgi:hypothetical protein